MTKNMFYWIMLIGVVSGINAHGNLLSYYTFDTDTTDAMGLRDGTIVGNASISSSAKIGGGALDLSGGHVDLPGGVAALNGLTTYTIAGWANVRTDNNFVEGLFTTDGAVGTDVHLYWYNTLVGTPHLDMQAFDGWVQGTTGVPAAPTDWFHFAAVRNGVNLAMYLNGALIGTATTGGTTFSNLGGDASIGSWQGNERFVDGLIDDFRIYNTALTEAEINALLIPEPTTITLLGLGLAIVLRRKVLA